MTKKISVNGFVKERFGDSSYDILKNSVQYQARKGLPLSVTSCLLQLVVPGAFPPTVFFDSLMARLHWRFLLRFQRRFQTRFCGDSQRFESPVVYTGDLKSPRNHRKNRRYKRAFRPVGVKRLFGLEFHALPVSLNCF